MRSGPLLSCAVKRIRADVFPGVRYLPLTSDAAEADFHARPISDEQARREKLLAPLMQEFTNSPADYWSIKIPVPAICVISGLAADFAWASMDSSSKMEITSHLRNVLNPFQRRGCGQLQREAPHARVSEMESWHYVFLADLSQVGQLIRAFLLQTTMAR